ncbi:hypothetical protein U1Q18_010430 [Sarracenia purpurea var. burkii]
MEEELQESEVIFPEKIVIEEDDQNAEKSSRNDYHPKKSSGPVNIPGNVSGSPWVQSGEFDYFEDDGDGELVPPHVVVGRRIFAGKMEFSVCTGNGRTLKGRDLSEVRNSILRMTGFLET